MEERELTSRSTRNRNPFPVDQTLRDAVLDGLDGILNVDDPPLSSESLSVLFSETGRATVVDVEDGVLETRQKREERWSVRSTSERSARRKQKESEEDSLHEKSSKQRSKTFQELFGWSENGEGGERENERDVSSKSLARKGKEEARRTHRTAMAPDNSRRELSI